jgi:hypothetical protein
MRCWPLQHCALCDAAAAAACCWLRLRLRLSVSGCGDTVPPAASPEGWAPAVAMPQAPSLGASVEQPAALSSPPPAVLRVLDFAEARAAEIATLDAALRARSPGGSTAAAAAAALPRHMRRRTRSHVGRQHIGRRRQRQGQQRGERAGAASGQPAELGVKQLNRRQRRQLPRLRRARERPTPATATEAEAEAEAVTTTATGPRQQPYWLETHVWQSKRMRMAAQHGYVVPLCPADKGLRATHRAAVGVRRPPHPRNRGTHTHARAPDKTQQQHHNRCAVALPRRAG